MGDGESMKLDHVADLARKSHECRHLDVLGSYVCNLGRESRAIEGILLSLPVRRFDRYLDRYTTTAFFSSTQRVLKGLPSIFL